LSDYVDEALAQAVFEKLADRSYAGRIPCCAGVIAFGASLRECENELRSTLEDWILVGLQLKHPLPVIAGIDLNNEPATESM
jgi:predicted RNase H-like HicB family nuclease